MAHKPSDFWNFVDKTQTCWLWTGHIHVSGYGRWRINGEPQRKTHRVSYELAYGPIPENLNVLHKCDVRNCVNPGHLFLGTDADNVADMVAKDRQAKGATASKTKLTELDVQFIRELYLANAYTQTELAKAFGVRLQSIHAIVVQRRTWRHLPWPYDPSQDQRLT